jgi:flagellar protein FlaG
MISPVSNKADLLTTPRKGGESDLATAKRPDAARTQRDSYYAEESRSTDRSSLSRADLDQAAAKVGEVLKAAGMHVKLLVDQESEQVVVKVMKESGEVIRQFPPEEVLELAKYLSEEQTSERGKGLFLEERV